MDQKIAKDKEESIPLMQGKKRGNGVFHHNGDNLSMQIIYLDARLNR